jgi:hypothetical protein
VSEVSSLLERFPNAVVIVGAYTIGKERIFKVTIRHVAVAFFRPAYPDLLFLIQLSNLYSKIGVDINLPMYLCSDLVSFG